MYIINKFVKTKLGILVKCSFFLLPQKCLLTVRKKSNQSAELFFAMNSFYFSDRKHVFSSSTWFSSFLSCRLAKIVNYHEHDNVSFSLIFAPFIMFVIFHGVPILKCMYCKSKLCWVKFSELNAVFLHEMTE